MVTINKKIFYLSVSVLAIAIFFIFAQEGFDLSLKSAALLDLENVKNSEIIDDFKNNCTKTSDNLMKFAAGAVYDKNTGIYYASNNNLKLEYHPRSEIKLFFDQNRNLYNIVAAKDNVYQEINLIITDTPIIAIETIKEKRRPLKKAKDYVILTAFDPDPQNKAVSFQIAMNHRGGSSRAYEKKSYTIKNLDKQVMSLYGLPLNEKYVLNSLYEDEYKIRDVLSWNIWSESSAYSNERGIFNSTKMVYVEVFVDNSYEGMYGLQDALTEYKFQLDKTKGTIFETRNYILPETDEFNKFANLWGGVTMRYSNLIDGAKWFGFEKLYMAFTTQPFDQAFIDDHVDLKSFLDYYVFTEFIQAKDNTWKNIYFTITEDTGKLMITPWDLDMTFGSHWTGEPPYLTETRYEPVTLYGNSQSPYFINRLINHHDTFQIDAAKRYFALRETLWTEEKILEKVKTYQEFLSVTGIYQRELQRWPNSPKIPEGKEDFIAEFVVEKMRIMDEMFAKTLAKEQT